MATWNGSEWVDDTNPNVTFKPVESGGDGMWHNVSEGTVMHPDGTWYKTNGGLAPTPITGTVAPPTAANSTTAFQTNPGSDFQYQENDLAARKLLQDSINASQEKITQMQTEANSLQGKEDNASRERIAQLQYQIGQETNRIALLNAQVNQAAEARQERELQSQLATNPQDFVQYEFYKRALGNPTTLGVANSMGGGGGGGGQGGANPGGAGTDANGYPVAPPAYSDQSLSGVANSLFNKTGAPWSPQLRGQGAFGATINAPNQIGRQQAGSLSDSEIGILSSFLKAGINMGNGQRTSIDPADYFKQMQNSWVPTLSGAGSMNNYS